MSGLMNGMSHGTEPRCVMSAMFWCTVLLEDKHVSSNAVDHCQQFLYQQQFLVILSVDFSARFNENHDGIIEF